MSTPTHEAAAGSRNLHTEIVFGLALLLAVYVAWLVREVLLLLFVSGLLAVALSPFVKSVSAFRVGKWQPFRGYAIFVILVLMALAVTAFGFLALPPVIQDLQQFGREMPTRSPQILQELQHIPILDRLNPGDFGEKLQSFASEAAGYLLVSFRSWAGKLVNFITGFVLVIYFLVEGDHAYHWFLSFWKPQSRSRLDATLQRAKTQMGKWLLGQGSLMLILGLSSTIMYLLLGVRYAYALGVVTGMLNIIPVVGALVSLILALLVAAIDSWGRVIGVTAFFLVYLQIENSFLIPHIMKNRVGLPGLAVLASLLLGSALAGVMGAMVSVPSAVLVAVLVDEYLVQKPAP
ncbi:MAG TPA: AI-2E family transporter [Terracidiphilus sp.]|nr:AI-2E family transporter [Terracidiphilus sp.]